MTINTTRQRKIAPMSVSSHLTSTMVKNRKGEASGVRRGEKKNIPTGEHNYAPERQLNDRRPRRRSSVLRNTDLPGARPGPYWIDTIPRRRRKIPVRGHVLFWVLLVAESSGRLGFLLNDEPVIHYWAAVWVVFRCRHVLLSMDRSSFMRGLW